MALITVKPSIKKSREIGQYCIRDRSSFYMTNSFSFYSVGKNIYSPERRKILEHVLYKQTSRNIHGYLGFYKIGSAVHISYIDQYAVETLLGTEGKDVLHKILACICNTARISSWPLKKIEMQVTSDIEVKNWNCILLVLFFAADFDTADKYLNLLYGELDNLAITLNDKERKILQRLIYFDVEKSEMVSTC